MTDILLRDVPDDIVAAIDASAKRLGLSRAAYLQRALARKRAAAAGDVSVGDLARLSRLTVDLDDPDVVSDAWS